MGGTNWIAVGAALLGGGAVGSIITLIASVVRNRKQPIAYRTEIVPVFKGGMFDGSDVTANLTLSSKKGGSAENISNLFVAQIELANRGNKDFASFGFGMTLSDQDVAVHCAINAADRHHQPQIVTPLSPAACAREIDCLLVPFNRGDRYKITLYVVVVGPTQQPGEIQLSSPEPIIFNKAPTVAEMAIEAASRVALEIGPLRVSIR
jgi:hypothetical protein